MVLAGANASAEEADDGTDEGSVSGVDVVLNHQLVETGFGSKKDFTVYLKDYMKKVVKYLEENNRSGEVDDFKKNISGVMKDLLGSFKDLQFYTGEQNFVLTGGPSFVTSVSLTMTGRLVNLPYVSSTRP